MTQRQTYTHEITSNQGGTPGSSSLTMHVHCSIRTAGLHSMDKLHSILQLVLAWGLKDVCSAQLQKFDSNSLPLLQEGDYMVGVFDKKTY